jgi:hypothetical protein
MSFRHHFYIELPIGLAKGSETAAWDEGIGPEPDWEEGSVLVDSESIICITESTDGKSTAVMVGGERYAIYASFTEVKEAIRDAVKEELTYVYVERTAE